ncbi:MAG: family transporter substrate-binding protein [Betaproteobacteria bacterium]|nr:family transporter substrate-binding protein [Betaproteobacteria bacterium]
MKRRTFLTAAAAAAVAPHISAAEPLKIGFIYSGPISDGGWTYQHELARKSIEAEFGDKIKTFYVESVPESAEAERFIRQFAMDGCKLIFTTSFGFMDPTIKVAKQFPKVIFEHATGYKQAPNVGIYQTRFYDGAYMMGVLAGKMTKTNVLGFVASFPIPEVLRNIDAFTIGAKSVNPAIKTKVVWVSTWFNPAKERQAAEALIGEKADVLYQNTDSPAVIQIAQEKGLYAFGQDSDMSKYGPKSQLSANTVNWGVYYKKKVADVLAGKWKSEDTKWGMKEGMIELVALNPAVPADVAKLYETKKKALLDGTLHTFGGPVKDNTGAIKVAAGQVLPEKDLWSLTWYVDGVEGSVPK